jgi:thymidylate synthase
MDIKNIESSLLNNNAKIFWPFYNELYEKKEKGEVLIDRTGCKIVELLAPKICIPMSEDNDGFIDFSCRKSPRKYIEKEGIWYGSHSLNIDKVSDVQMWTCVCDKTFQINSNYGYLVFDKGNYNQFEHAALRLESQKQTREAIIIYNRPSIQLEANDLGGQDFICTLDQHFFIRPNTDGHNSLICITEMRSNDCITGTFSDIPWFTSVYKKMYDRLLKTYPDLKYGEMIFIPNSFHCYERNFDKLEGIAKGWTKEELEKNYPKVSK